MPSVTLLFEADCVTATVNEAQVTATVNDAAVNVTFPGTQGPAGPAGSQTLLNVVTDDTVVPGQAVYFKPTTGRLGLSRADADATARVDGIVTVGASPTFTATVLVSGTHTLADWTAVIGSATLTPGAVYFLSETTAGGLTTTPPSSAGESITKVGKTSNVAGTQLHVFPRVPIGL